MRRTRTAGFHLLAGGLSVLWLLPIALVLTTSVRTFPDIASNGLGAL
ncbi:MAG: multiple sugar transport system permease protein, partial [Actinomycetota bacterium]|nr:multiple sugar transport system permease protein [Actinomycetota bacterium]